MALAATHVVAAAAKERWSLVLVSSPRLGIGYGREQEESCMSGFTLQCKENIMTMKETETLEVAIFPVPTSSPLSNLESESITAPPIGTSKEFDKFVLLRKEKTA